MRAAKHHTKHVGDLGLMYILADLTRKGWAVFLPVSEHLAVDLIATKRIKGKERILKIQAKYSSTDTICKRSNNNYYSPEDFDFYAVYLASVERVIYIKSDWPVSKVATDERRCYSAYYWWEHFLRISTRCPKKIKTRPR